ncbi:MAG: aldehyde dehydrogenase EutE [Spirochaetes bacterium]|nr:aldehyde dehydrogenase EutE [Spirochaetota bacterium]
MDQLEQNIRKLVENVLQDMNISNISQGYQEDKKLGVFTQVSEAAAAAAIAHQQLMKLPLAIREDIIKNIRETMLAHAEALSKMASEETGFGRWQDKVIKHQLVALKTPGVEDLVPESFTDDHGLTLVEHAPYGVIGSIIPSTNPSSTVINNSIGMIAGGNSVVFNPHPAAKKVSCYAISLINDAVVKAGGPMNLITGIATPTIESAQELMSHSDISLLVVTGGPAVVKVAMNSGKKVIAAGPGNPPCVVDETADLAKAGKDIVNGAGFDNNIICICEKEVIVVASVADRLKEEMKKNGAYELNTDQINALTKLVIAEPGGPGKEGFPNKKYVGKNASVIARDIGLQIDDSVKILLCEVGREHPLVWTEQLMPVIPLVRVNHVDDAIDLAFECEHGFRHTAVMHSLNIEKLSKMAKLMNCSLFVKNGSSYCGLGSGGAGFTSFTIASPTGDGLTRARTFTRERRCTLVDYFRIV